MATGKMAYVIRINSSDPYSLSPNSGRRHIIIKRCKGSLRYGGLSKIHFYEKPYKCHKSIVKKVIWLVQYSRLNG